MWEHVDTLSKQLDSAKSNKVLPPKNVDIIFRLDPDLKRRVEEKAQTRGWSVGAVLRALLRTWLEEDIVDATEVGSENLRAPKKQRKR